MKQWLARMLARPGLEDIIESYPSEQQSGKGMLCEIWDAKKLQSFEGPNGTPFIRAEGHEGRLIFGLNIDGFNLFRMVEVKKKVSIQGIYLICLNLPPDLRYRPENMFLAGVIPGPGKPSLEQINHFVRFLVNEMLKFWNPGVAFSRTAKYPQGRLIRAALIPLICDILGAKQVAGFGSANSRFFCSHCELEVSEVENFDRHTWPSRDLRAPRTRAEAWKNTESTAHRRELFDQFGIQWSELLRLPYWNPIRFTVIDSMHNLYLGLLENHCRDVWGISVSLEDAGDGSSSHKKGVPERPSVKDMSSAYTLLRRQIRRKWKSFRDWSYGIYATTRISDRRVLNTKWPRSLLSIFR